MSDALLARYYELPRGPRVCLRLVRPRDRSALERLLRAQGAELTELGLARLIYFDLSERIALCATALLHGREHLVGVGTVELTGDQPPAPAIVAVDRDLTEGLPELLAGALSEHAEVIRRSRAA